MLINDIITDNFAESIQAKQEVAVTIKPSIKFAIEMIISAFKNGNKILICGNGGSAADSQHFAAEFTGRYEIERKPLPALALTTDTSALTAISNDYSFYMVFAKQVEALGVEGDILFAISTSGNSGNIIKAIETAQAKNMRIITLTGRDGGKMAKMLTEHDINICAHVWRTARIQEVHILVMHTICDAIDTIMFKS